MSGIQAFFSFMRSKASYVVMGMQGTMSAGQTTTQGIYGGSTVSSMTVLSTQPTSTAVKHVGLAVDGSFVAQTNGYYSLNAGSSWTSWGAGQNFDYSYATATPGTGLSGTIAYNPTAKRAMTWNITYIHSGYISLISVTSLGVVTATSPTGMAPGAMPAGIIYSSAHNTFYAMQFGGAADSFVSANGTTGAYATGGGTGSNSAYKPGVSHNGYPLTAVFPGYGTSYYLREYTTSDLSTYTQHGFITGSTGNANRSPFFYAAINGKYYLAQGSGSGATITIYSATTAAPHTYTSIGSFSPTDPGGSTYGISSLQMIEESDGTLWCFGLYVQDMGSYFYYTRPYTFYSTDTGVTWTVKSGQKFATLAKNYNP